mmetsp:Transcript_44878/g.97652  ORF Transcript_44878/g.97652 Transcript_44878/m.97652 type:complete len:105 (-) Transcript_44878:749-1063(-)
MSLQCRGTFLDVVEHVDVASRSRRHSYAEGLQDCEYGSQDRLLQKAADSFAWHLDTQISRGSYGHPNLCAAPCIRASVLSTSSAPRVFSANFATLDIPHIPPPK